MKKALVFIIPALFLALAACGESKDEEALRKARETELANITEGEYKPPEPAPLPDGLVIEVPDSVKAKYSVVTVGVGNRKTKEMKEFKVRIGKSAPVPGTDYKIEVLTYLPDWSVRGKTVTSKSDQPKDPAIRAIIYEKDKEVFNGFIFEKHKTPSFINEAWVIGLLGAS